jgi:Arc/MetJ family transcription regulator
MRTTVTIDADLPADAKRFTGIDATSVPVKNALALLLRHEGHGG